MKTTFKIAAILAAVVVIVVIVFVLYTVRTKTLRGPMSPDGHTVVVKVSDMQIGPGADYYADVTVLDSKGSKVAFWEDPDGQESMPGATAMVNSMAWKDHALTFTTSIGSNIVLKLY